MNIETIEKDVKNSRWIVVVIFGLVLGGFSFWFWIVQKQPLSTDSSSWGTFGDFVGGILNPLIAFAAFYWLTQSVLVQKQELNETKIALIETSKAQKEQSENQRIQIKIGLLNSKLAILNIELEAEYTYRSAMFQRVGVQQSNNNSKLKLISRDGQLVEGKDNSKIFEDINLHIQNLREQQVTLLKEIESLTNELPTLNNSN